MSSPIVHKQMSAEQQAELMRFAKVGLKWVSGEISFEEVTRMLGQPKKFEPAGGGEIDYAYFPAGMTIDFYFDKLRQIEGRPSVDFFSVKVDDNIHTNIPREEIQEILKLRPMARGELFDGVRRDVVNFFSPTGAIDITGTYPKNYVTFSYRLPMTQDSPFDVQGGFSYLGEWANENGEKTLGNIRRAVDLRDFGINRHYLTPEELEERNLAKREQYGYMNLRTGMVCPETGWWEGWTAHGVIDKQLIRQSRLFPQASLGPNRTAPDGAWFVDALWMWHGPVAGRG